MSLISRAACACFAVVSVSTALAQETPQERRHELMERMGDAAEPVGNMLKAEQAFDAVIVMDSLNTFADIPPKFVTLFPAGSESGYDTEARATIWTDRAGFEAALTEFSDAVDVAIAAAPQDLESLNTAAGPVFKQCKACHEDYRIEKE